MRQAKVTLFGFAWNMRSQAVSSLSEPLSEIAGGFPLVASSVQFMAILGFP